MLTGEKLGAAIDQAIKMKGVSKAAVARHFKVKPPSINDWIKRGTIDKSKLDELFLYFSDVVRSEHWGISNASSKHWPIATKASEIPSPPCRPLVQIVCTLAEQIDDNGLRELAGFARCLTGTHPLAKKTRAA